MLKLSLWNFLCDGFAFNITNCCLFLISLSFYSMPTKFHEIVIINAILCRALFQSLNHQQVCRICTAGEKTIIICTKKVIKFDERKKSIKLDKINYIVSNRPEKFESFRSVSNEKPKLKIIHSLTKNHNHSNDIYENNKEHNNNNKKPLILYI